MLAALATLIVTGTTSADEAGKARLSDMTFQSTTSEDVVIRGSSDIRQRNARTSQALRQLLTGSSGRAPQPRRSVQPVSHNAVTPVSACCPTDSCCPTCAAPADCCPPACAAPAQCCAPECCAPAQCCPADAGCCPAPCCACPAGGCDCTPSCNCPAGNCCCPQQDNCCAPNACACPASANACCPDACDGCGSGKARLSDGFGFLKRDKCSACGGRGCGRCRRGGRHGACANQHWLARCLGNHAAAHRARNRYASAAACQYFRCKFGFLIHDGNGGVGSPLFGHYSIVYPADPNYFDGRDGQVYAAQGYGGAVSVPLAPTVRNAYNYSWGVPSSRITPVSNTTP